VIGRDSFCLATPAEERVSRNRWSDASRCSEQQFLRSACQCLGSMAPLCIWRFEVVNYGYAKTYWNFGFQRNSLAHLLSTTSNSSTRWLVDISSQIRLNPAIKKLGRRRDY
jgi:hypothetical protein